MWACTHFAFAVGAVLACSMSQPGGCLSDVTSSCSSSAGWLASSWLRLSPESRATSDDGGRDAAVSAARQPHVNCRQKLPFLADKNDHQKRRRTNCSGVKQREYENLEINACEHLEEASQEGHNVLQAGMKGVICMTMALVNTCLWQGRLLCPGCSQARKSQGWAARSGGCCPGAALPEPRCSPAKQSLSPWVASLVTLPCLQTPFSEHSWFSSH